MQNKALVIIDIQNDITKHYKDIIGNINAITYKEVFPLLKSNKIWLGPSITSGDILFMIPDSIYNPEAVGARDILIDGHHHISVMGVRWFTNLDHGPRHQPMQLMTEADNILSF